MGRRVRLRPLLTMAHPVRWDDFQTLVKASYVTWSTAVSTGYIHGNIKERAMQFIPTTATAAEKLKRQAKTLRKTTGTSLAAALDAVAKQYGYEHWKHVTLCLEQTKAHKPLPEILANDLQQAAEHDPASPETKSAFAHGFVFAMDVKDALELSLTSDYTECQDGWYLAAKYLWPDLVNYRDEETGTTLAETQEPEELLDIAREELHNYRFYRFSGRACPTIFEDAYKCVSQLSFFPPTHIWLQGQFIDIREVPEIQVDGKIVLSNMNGVTVLSSNAAAPRPAKASQPLTFSIDKIEPGLYRVAVHSGGVDVTEPSHYVSIEEAIRETATDVPEGFAEYAQVVYAGISSGTMPIQTMVQTASQIAQQLVSLAGEMHGD